MKNVFLVTNEELMIDFVGGVKSGFNDNCEINSICDSQQVKNQIEQLDQLDLAVVDLKYNGLEIMKIIKEKFPNSFRILFTGNNHPQKLKINLENDEKAIFLRPTNMSLRSQIKDFIRMYF